MGLTGKISIYYMDDRNVDYRYMSVDIDKNILEITDKTGIIRGIPLVNIRLFIVYPTEEEN